MAYRQTREAYWTTARYNSNCQGCQGRIIKGQPLYYAPTWKRGYCEACGKEKDKGRLAEQSYERFGTDCMYDC